MAPVSWTLMSQPVPFVLYTKTGCPWCLEAVGWLRQHGYGFQEVDVRRDPAGMAEMRRISGQTLAPTLVVGDKVLPDFDTRQLEAFLTKHGLAKA